MPYDGCRLHFVPSTLRRQIPVLNEYHTLTVNTTGHSIFMLSLAWPNHQMCKHQYYLHKDNSWFYTTLLTWCISSLDIFQLRRRHGPRVRSGIHPPHGDHRITSAVKERWRLGLRSAAHQRVLFSTRFSTSALHSCFLTAPPGRMVHRHNPPICISTIFPKPILTVPSPTAISSKRPASDPPVLRTRAAEFGPQLSHHRQHPTSPWVRVSYKGKLSLPRLPAVMLLLLKDPAYVLSVVG